MAAIAPVKASTIINHALARLTTSATVGVDATFDPEGKNPQGVTSWVDRSSGIAQGMPRLTLQVRPPVKASRIFKVTAKLVRPTMETVTASTATGIAPAPTKAYDCTAMVEFFLPERSSLAEREALYSQTCSLMLELINASDGAPTDATGSPLKSAVLNFEQPY